MRSLITGDIPAPERAEILLSGTSSDAHTWNLVFLQLLLEEAGHRVANLGPCVPAPLLVEEALELAPRLIVLGSVNGHGHQDGLQAVRALRARPELALVPVVIGGKLGVNGPLTADRVRELTDAGFDEVFGDADIGAFVSYLSRFELRVAS
ncbi:cobalamin B12-binding domain-containing protein [Nocardiopsis flavescens]|uniref:Methylaspartate mutase sigma subunit n=1 Tax=Nocardiopsis flavescens TaxID=758803 RepID=A0A1M6N6T3_9ACTN|nr:cobalamin-dependent protein [Nocardiopsis flavescens]SHJ91363.1 methylaspartate mutase sigma subunit [Nocardiopsis flavescens]